MYWNTYNITIHVATLIGIEFKHELPAVWPIIAKKSKYVFQKNPLSYAEISAIPVQLYQEISSLR